MNSYKTLKIYDQFCEIPSVVVGGRVVIFDARKASLASFAANLLSNLSNSINQMDGQTLENY